MLEFRKLNLDEIDKLKDKYTFTFSHSCDDTPGIIMMWRNYFSTEIADFDGNFIFSVFDSDNHRSFVVPHENKIAGINAIIEYCRKENIEPTFFAVCNRDLSLLKENYTVISEEKSREWFDYLYDAEKMKTFSGKKLQGQRNHKNNFIKSYPNWEFVTVTKENLHAARDFYEYFSSVTSKDEMTFDEEERIVREVFDNFEVYGFQGGMIVCDGVVYGIGFCEKVGDTLFCHIEKARREINGAYQMIASEIVSHFADADTKFVNREDDGGDEGLRKSKLSYKPVELIEKSRVTLKI